MVFQLLADLLLGVHLLFVVFATLGALLLIRWPWVVWGHLPAVGWAAWIEFSGKICPLTPLENFLRAEAGLSRSRDLGQVVLDAWAWNAAREGSMGPVCCPS